MCNNNNKLYWASSITKTANECHHYYYACVQVMRHMSPAECSDLERLLTEESSTSKDGASISMAHSPTKVKCIVIIFCPK